jgi:Phage integrase family
MTQMAAQAMEIPVMTLHTDITNGHHWPVAEHIRRNLTSKQNGWRPPQRDCVPLCHFPADERQLHWHDLRHTAAVMLFRSGVSAPDVQAILGHSSLAVTQILRIRGGAGWFRAFGLRGEIDGSTWRGWIAFSG